MAHLCACLLAVVLVCDKRRESNVCRMVWVVGDPLNYKYAFHNIYNCILKCAVTLNYGDFALCVHVHGCACALEI